MFKIRSNPTSSDFYPLHLVIPFLFRLKIKPAEVFMESVFEISESSYY